MSELQVPDFNTLDDFTNWVKKLEDKEIQSWTTKDWLKMYDKLEAYTASEAFTKVYEQKIPELISSGKLAGTVENWLSSVSDPLSRKQLFVQVETLDMGKLYRNFRFEPEQSKYIRDIARKAGEKLADTGVSTAKFSIPSNDLDKRKRDLIDVAHSANDIVRKSTAYEKMGKEAMLNTMVEVDDMIWGSGDASPISKGLSRMRLNSLKQWDATVQMVFHEAAHLHFQTQNPLQQDLFTQQNITAHPELGTDFQKLMDKNRQFYLNPTSIEKDLEVLAGMPYEEYKKVYRKALRGYRSEPMERYSYIYGQEAERAYRRASGYYSERTAMKIADRIATPLISGTIDVGRPEQVRHTEKGIELTYKSYDTEPEKLEKAIKAKFAHADETLLRDIDIKANKLFGEVKITVPNSYDFTSRYNKYVTTPPPPPPPPPVINAKNEFPSSLPGNVEAPSIENSTLKKVRTTEEKSAGVDAGLSTGEKAEQAAAKTATKSALENQAKETGRATTKAATKATLKTQAANVAKQTGKAVAKTANSIGKAALEANAKFDAAVDKAIEKGTQKLNNSKVGKAYNKIAANASQTKVGKAVAKATSKAVEKAAATTAGKAVGKVVAKTVGTAVGKSVLKKIPLVSAGAGAYFAYERIKNGEWKAAGCEMLSGIAGCFPGLGTAASVAIDTGLAANDIHNAIKENNKQTAQAETKTSTKTQTAKKVAPKDLSKQIAERTEAKKKVTQKTTLSAKQMAQAQQNSRA